MNLDKKATFTAHQCVILIMNDEGASARVDISSKLTLLRRGLCNVHLLEGDAAALEEDSMTEEGVRACQDLRLVLLAARWWMWLEQSDGTPQDVDVETDPYRAGEEMAEWLTQTPD